MHQLLVTGARQARIGERGDTGGSNGTRRAHPPLPLEPDALEVRHRLMVAARVAAEHLPQSLGLGYGLLHDLVETATRVIDRPPDLVFAGTCQAELAERNRCPARIYAQPGLDAAVCPACEHLHQDVQERRAALLRAAEDVLETASNIAAGLGSLGEREVTASKIRGLAHRQRIYAKAHDRKGRPLYRVGDVREALSRSGSRASASS